MWGDLEGPLREHLGHHRFSERLDDMKPQQIFRSSESHILALRCRVLVLWLQDSLRAVQLHQRFWTPNSYADQGLARHLLWSVPFLQTQPYLLA